MHKASFTIYKRANFRLHARCDAIHYVNNGQSYSGIVDRIIKHKWLICKKFTIIRRLEETTANYANFKVVHYFEHIRMRYELYNLQIPMFEIGHQKNVYHPCIVFLTTFDFMNPNGLRL